MSKIHESAGSNVAAQAPAGPPNANTSLGRARLLYHNERFGIEALVESIQIRYGVAVYMQPPTAAPSDQAHLAELSPTAGALLSHVVQAIGSKMLFACKSRLIPFDSQNPPEVIVEYVGNFDNPRQKLVHMGLRTRGEGTCWAPSPAIMDRTEKLLRLSPQEAAELDARLAVQDAIRDTIDSPLPAAEPAIVTIAREVIAPVVSAPQPSGN